jgi:hypothetical protein
MLTRNQAIHNSKYLLSQDTYVTPLLILLIDSEGTDALGWHPDTVRIALENRYEIKIPSYTIDKIFAGITLLTTDLFYTDVKSFIDICNCFCGSSFNPLIFDPATVLEMSWTITEAHFLDPQDDTNVFSDEIKKYIGFVLREEGFIKPPDILSWAMNANFENMVATNYVDDPALFQMIYATHQNKTMEIESEIARMIRELDTQVADLFLDSGKKRSIVEFIGKTQNG